MSEDTQVQQEEQNVTEQVEQQQTEQPQFSEHEQTALDQGWKPKDQWIADGGDPDEWKPAKAFIRDGELFSKMDGLKRQLKDTQKALHALQSHHEKVKEVEYKRALDTLKEEKKAALIDGDPDKVVEIDEQILDLKAQQQAQKKAAEIPQGPDPRFLQWVEKNSWYGQDSEMRELADRIGISHAQAHPEKDPDEVLAYVEQRIRKSYPEKFQNQNRTRPSSVEGSGNQVATSRKKDSFVLSDEERRIMNTFVRQGVMTEEQYIKDLKAVRGIKE